MYSLADHLACGCLDCDCAKADDGGLWCKLGRNPRKCERGKNMSREKVVKLTEVEANFILTLIENNENEGWYYGNKEQYFKRLERVKAKLEKVFDEE